MRVLARAWIWTVAPVFSVLLSACTGGGGCVHKNGNGSWCDGTRIMECTDSSHVPDFSEPSPYEIRDCADQGATCSDSGESGQCVVVGPTCTQDFCDGQELKECWNGRVLSSGSSCTAFGGVCREAPEGAVCVFPDVPCEGWSECDGDEIVRCLDGLRRVRTPERCATGLCAKRNDHALCVDPALTCESDGVCVDGAPFECAGGFRALETSGACAAEEICDDSSGVAGCEHPGHCTPTQEFEPGEERHNERRDCSSDTGWLESDTGLALDEQVSVVEIDLALPLRVGTPYAFSFDLDPHEWGSRMPSSSNTVELWGGSHPGALVCGKAEELLFEAQVRAGVLCAEVTPTAEHEELFVVVRGANAESFMPLGAHRCPAGACPLPG